MRNEVEGDLDESRHSVSASQMGQLIPPATPYKREPFCTVEHCERAILGIMILGHKNTIDYNLNHFGDLSNGFLKKKQ